MCNQYPGGRGFWILDYAWSEFAGKILGDPDKPISALNNRFTILHEPVLESPPCNQYPGRWGFWILDYAYSFK